MKYMKIQTDVTELSNISVLYLLWTTRDYLDGGGGLRVEGSGFGPSGSGFMDQP